MAVIDFRERLLQCLGGDWPEPCELKARVSEVVQLDGYRREMVTYEAEPGDRIPAYLLIPDGVSAQSPAPAVCVWHQHAGQWAKGKSEPAGIGWDPMHHTGVALCREGYVVLCPDALCFEDRQDSSKRQLNGSYERFEFLRYVVAGKCMAWKNILDMRRAVDFLISREEVKAERLGCYGHSMGSTFTWLLGPWEPRMKCLVGNCCLPTYAGIHREHMLHCFPNFIPGLFQYGDTFDVAALTAPRALHLNFGDLDSGSPIDEVRRGLPVIARAYESVHAEQNFSYFIQEQTGHVLSPEMWQRTRDWLKLHLQG